jgi:hypothetical protein
MSSLRKSESPMRFRRLLRVSSYLFITPLPSRLIPRSLLRSICFSFVNARELAPGFFTVHARSLLLLFGSFVPDNLCSHQSGIALKRRT